ncbi:MAG: winged helix-turn-helix domain-containing protein [Acidobacteria bacterium]|nr:winged helix-turn-helix domain-containing protein [Acidobacteriota bacterium]
MNGTDHRTYNFGSYQFDPARLLLLREGKIIQVTPKALEILDLLIRERERLVSRRELMAEIWPDTFVEEANINLYISILRKTLGQNGTAETQYIRTVSKKGYRFVADVTEEPAENSESGQVFAESSSDSAEAAPADVNTKHHVSSRPRYRMTAVAGMAVLAVFAIGFSGWMLYGMRATEAQAGSAYTTDAARRGTASTEAYNNYLRGRRIWEGRWYSIEQPVEYFRKAVEADPNFAAAHLAMADAYAFDASPEIAEAALSRAMDLDPNLHEAYATHGFIRMFHYWDWAGAEASLKKATELGPNDAKSRHWYGVYLSLMGRMDEAHEQMNIASRLAPTSLIIMSDIGQLHYFSRNYGKATEQLEEVFRIEPKFTMARRYMYSVYLKQGRHSEAMDAMVNSRVSTAETVAEYRRLFTEKGIEGFWRHRIGSAGCDDASPDSVLNCAEYYILLGKREDALSMLEAAAEQRVFMLPFINIDPMWDDLRDEPRFTAILTKMGLQEKR